MNNLSRNNMFRTTEVNGGMSVESCLDNYDFHNLVNGVIGNDAVVTEIEESDTSIASVDEIHSNRNQRTVNGGANPASITNIDDESENAAGVDEADFVERDQFDTEGQNRDALSCLPYEWSPILEEMANSVQHMERTYYEGKEFVPDGQLYENGYELSTLAFPNDNRKSLQVKTVKGIKDNWVDAPVFQPAYVSETGRVKSYAEAVDPYAPRNRTKLEQGVQYCPFVHLDQFEMSVCPYLHGLLCPICLTAILDYEDTEEKRNHIKACLKDQETKIKMSLAIQKSKGIACNICLEYVKDKISGEARFGILPNCNHCFCITCIRKWRQEARYSSQVTKSTFFRACPICRVESPFVCPSAFWVETPQEKEALISDYKKALRVKPCRLFNYGEGKCPFGEKCFYMHSLPDGTKAPPESGPRPVRLNAEGTAQVQEYVLWDFIAARDNPENYQPTLPAQRNNRYNSSQDCDSASQ